MENHIKTILIVDDTPKNLQVLGNTLKQKNYKIEFAVNGKDAIEWINKKDFDLVLLDVMMPDLNGYETCEIIRKGNIQNDIPIIFLTAKTDSESIVKGFELGGQDYITKPFNNAELFARVKTQIELKLSREKLQTMNLLLEGEVIKRTKELQEANTKLEKANFDLSMLDKAKTDFLNIISHELRTPLNGIIGALYLIKHKPLPKETIKFIDLLDLSVKRLEKFSLQALDITILKTREYPIKITDVIIKKLIDFTLKEVAEKTEEKKIKFKFTGLEQAGSVKADYKLLKTVMLKLLENAIKHSPIADVIELVFSINHDKLSIEIIGKGKGFSSEFLDMNFSPFSTGSEHINLNMGIDLTLVKLITDAHKGEIILKNNKNGGATVLLILNKFFIG